MPTYPSHIQQLPGGPIGTVARPVGGGCDIYCATGNTVGCSGSIAGLAELTFTLTGRSTFNVQIVWTMDGDGYSTQWGLNPDGNVSFPLANAGATRGVTTAMTRSAGVYTVTASSFSSGSNNGTIMIVVIVGSDTEDDCVTIENVS